MLNVFPVQGAGYKTPEECLRAQAATTPNAYVSYLPPPIIKGILRWPLARCYVVPGATKVHRP